MDLMPFGKFRNQPVRDVPKGYLAWLSRECDLREPLRSAVEAALVRQAASKPNLGTEPQSVLDEWLSDLKADYAADLTNWRVVVDAYRRLTRLLLTKEG